MTPADEKTPDGGTGHKRDGRLAEPPVVERSWCPDQQAMLAALRVALGLARVPVGHWQERKA